MNLVLHKMDDPRWKGRAKWIGWPALFLMILSCTRQEIPTSIDYRSTKEGRYQYVISDVYLHEDRPTIELSTAERFFPTLISLEWDRETRRCRFSTQRKLKVAELEKGINLMATHNCRLPYWCELQARDIPRSPAFLNDRFTVVEQDSPFPKGLKWITVPEPEWIESEREQLSRVEAGFRWRPGGEGKFVINPATGLCMCHSRYAMRILDDEGRLVWIDDTTAYGFIRFAIVDRNQDGADEIFLIRNVHGGEDVVNFYIK